MYIEGNLAQTPWLNWMNPFWYWQRYRAEQIVVENVLNRLRPVVEIEQPNCYTYLHSITNEKHSPIYSMVAIY